MLGPITALQPVSLLSTVLPRLAPDPRSIADVDARRLGRERSLPRGFLCSGRGRSCAPGPFCHRVPSRLATRMMPMVLLTTALQPCGWIWTRPILLRLTTNRERQRVSHRTSRVSPWAIWLARASMSESCGKGRGFYRSSALRGAAGMPSSWRGGSTSMTSGTGASHGSFANRSCGGASMSGCEQKTLNRSRTRTTDESLAGTTMMFPSEWAPRPAWPSGRRP
jgi:hypothetical protein